MFEVMLGYRDIGMSWMSWMSCVTGGETYVWFSSKRLCHFRQRLHDRLKDAMCRLGPNWNGLCEQGVLGWLLVAINRNGN